MKNLIGILILIFFIFVLVYGIVFTPNTLEKMDQVHNTKNTTKLKLKKQVYPGPVYNEVVGFDYINKKMKV